jgi:hypothetical protein
MFIGLPPGHYATVVEVSDYVSLSLTWILLQAFDRFLPIASYVANDIDGIDH